MKKYLKLSGLIVGIISAATNTQHKATFYSAGENGYTDHPFMSKN